MSAPIDLASQNVFDIIHTTRTMRRLKPDPVPDELVVKILEAGIKAPNGGNSQTWHFVVVKDVAIKKAVQVIYKRAFDEIISPRYTSSPPPPGSDAAKYKRQHKAVEYLTDHYHEAPVWIVACLRHGDRDAHRRGQRALELSDRRRRKHRRRRTGPRP